jgi:hypothetical protein
MVAARASSARLVHADTGVGHPSREEVNTMAASIPIEQESGMAVGRVHPHNGYYAGDFTSARHAPPPAPGTDPRAPLLSVTGDHAPGSQLVP